MDEPVTIVCNANGPLRVTGNFVIKDPQGNSFSRALLPKLLIQLPPGADLRTLYIENDISLFQSMTICRAPFRHATNNYVSGEQVRIKA